MAKIVNISDPIYTFEEVAPSQAIPIQYTIDENGCHICKSHAVDKDSYPRVHRHGKDKRMSRYVWQVANQQIIPKGMLVMHICDNPECVNPEHLKLGTHKDNMADRQRKGRTLKGSQCGMAKLTEADAHFILFDSDNLSSDELAEIFKVSPRTIQSIQKRESWKHLTKDNIVDTIPQKAS